MKTTILTIAILLTAVLGINQSTFAASFNSNEVSTILPVTSPISKIEVHGNVELYVSSGNTNQVKVYNTYYAENALIQDDKGLLRISSYNEQKLIVWVTVTDLRNLEVYDTASVKSFGKLSAIDLDVKLYNNAFANLDLDAYHAEITLSDHAKANVSGDIQEGNMKYDLSASLNTSDLVSAQLIKTLNAKGAITDGDSAELVIL